MIFFLSLLASLPSSSLPPSLVSVLLHPSPLPFPPFIHTHTTHTIQSVFGDR